MANIPGLYAYSFKYFNASIIGLGGNFALAEGAGAAEGGISFEFEMDSNQQTVGADGSVMNTLIQARNGVCTVRLLQTSPVCQQLDTMFNLQHDAGIGWGANVISGTDSASGDFVKASGVAFRRQPGLVKAMRGAELVYPFHVAQLYIQRGSGVLGTLGSALNSLAG